MYAEFEEKPYEQHLTSALVHSKGLFFPPGQVLEGVLGFDVALRTKSPEFWRLFRHTWRWWRVWPWRYLNGLEIDSSWWNELEQEIDYFPKMRFNCFVQAKRPNRMVRSDAAEYSHWKREYFRYDTFPSQQSALSHLATQARGRAIVVYACPAFHTFHDLWNAIDTGTLIQRSNFCEAQNLDGHRRYSFVSAGNRGIAHSEPEEVESVPFESALNSLRAGEPSEISSNLDFLLRTGKELDAASEGLGKLRTTYQAMSKCTFQGVAQPLARALAKIYAFQFITSTRMLIGHDRP